MYTEIGFFEAKVKLFELLRAVQQGQRYTITLHGCPVADLVPNQNANAAIEAMRNIRKIRGVSDETVTERIAEGRR